MKTKKCGVYAALAAVLLITAMLVTCADPLTLGDSTAPQKGEREVFTPPPGKAYIVVNLQTTAEAGRTILGSDPGTITNYKVFIVDEGTGGTNYTEAAAVGTYNNFGTDNKEIFTVSNSRSYQITVLGFTSSGATDPVVGGQVAGITTNASGVGTTTTPIAMRAVFADENGTQVTGTFNYNFTLPAGLDVAELNVTPYSGGATVTRDLLDNSTANAGTITLNSGYYWARVSLEQNRHVDAMYSNILHVHGNGTSTWATSLKINKKTFDVTYNENGSDADDTTVDDNGGTGWANGGTVDILAAYDTEDSGADPVKTGYGFNGWFTEATDGVKWVFGNTGTKIYGDTELFAQYTILPSGGLNITITPYVYQEELTFSLSSVSIAHTTIIDNSYNINVTAAAIANATIVGWSYEGTPITSSATLTKGLIASETGIDFSVRGSYEFTYTVTIGNPAVPYNGTLTINVTPLP